MSVFSTYNVYDSASSNSAVVTKPASVVDGDLMFALVNSNAAYANATPAGWIRDGQNNPTSTYCFELYHKIASSEGANYTWGFAAAQNVRITVFNMRGGFDTSNPIDVVSNTAYTTVGTNCRAATMTVTSKNSPLIYFGSAFYTSAAKIFTPPTTQNNQWLDDLDAGNANSDFYNGISDTFWSNTNGATGNIDGVMNNSTVTAKHAFAVALNPKGIAVIGGLTFGWDRFDTLGDGTNPTITKPANVLDGDLLVASGLIGSSSITLTPPAGWTQLCISASGNNSYIWYKIASGEGASFVFTKSNSAVSGVILQAFRNVSNTNTLAVTPFSNTEYITNDTTLRAGGITTVKVNSLTMFNGFFAGGSSISTPPTGWALLNNLSVDNLKLNIYAMPLYMYIYGTGVSTGNIDVTINSATTSKKAFLFVINEVATTNSNFFQFF